MRGNGRDCQKFDCDVSGAAPGRRGWRKCSSSDTCTPAWNTSEAAGLTPAFALKASKMKTKTAHLKPQSVRGPARAGGNTLTDHVVGNVDLDLSLVLEGHLALDALVCLFLFGNQKKRVGGN